MTTVEISKLQVPMPKELRDSWEEKARSYGFDSLQAYVRFLAKADVDGRKVDLDIMPTLSSEASQRYAKEITEHEKAKSEGKTQSYDNAKDLMRDLLGE